MIMQVNQKDLDNLCSWVFSAALKVSTHHRGCALRDYMAEVRQIADFGLRMIAAIEATPNTADDYEETTVEKSEADNAREVIENG